jgi:hypothetical protein
LAEIHLCDVCSCPPRPAGTRAHRGTRPVLTGICLGSVCSCPAILNMCLPQGARAVTNQVSQSGWLLSRRGRGSPAHASGVSTHRVSISSRVDHRGRRALRSRTVAHLPTRAAPTVSRSPCGGRCQIILWAAALTEIHLCHVGAGQEMLKRNGRGQGDGTAGHQGKAPSRSPAPDAAVGAPPRRRRCAASGRGVTEICQRLCTTSRR